MANGMTDIARMSVVAQMRGKAIVTNSEFKSTAQFNMNFIKALSGFDDLWGKYYHENPWPFKFYGVWMARANEIPHFGAYDESIRERIRIINIEKEVPMEDRIYEYETILAKEEGLALLATCISFGNAFISGQLSEPKSVLLETKEKFTSDNVVANTLGAWFVFDPEAKYTRAELADAVKYFMEFESTGSTHNLTTTVIMQRIKESLDGQDVKFTIAKGNAYIKGIALNFENMEEDLSLFTKLKGAIKREGLLKQSMSTYLQNRPHMKPFDPEQQGKEENKVIEAHGKFTKEA
jgi:hypothetical protein